MPAWINASFRIAFVRMLLLSVANIVIIFWSARGWGEFSSSFFSPNWYVPSTISQVRYITTESISPSINAIHCPEVSVLQKSSTMGLERGYALFSRSISFSISAFNASMDKSSFTSRCLNWPMYCCNSRPFLLVLELILM